MAALMAGLLADGSAVPRAEMWAAPMVVLLVLPSVVYLVASRAVLMAV